MAKLLLLVAAMASSMFLLTQLITYYDFNEVSSNISDPLSSSRDEETVDLQTTINSFLQICDGLTIKPTLSHQDILKEFIDQEKTHRLSGQHDHYKCNILCKHRYVSFRVYGDQLQGKMDTFMARASNAGFNVVEDEDHDQRFITIENRTTRKVLLYHIYMELKNTMIHVVLVYPRYGREWTNVCNLELTRNSYFQWFLKKSPYCLYQQLIPSLSTNIATIDGLKIEVPDSIKIFISYVNDSQFLPCNYAIARKFVSTYGYDSSPESNEFRTKAKEILSLAVKLLNTLGIRFWLSSGTCLGWFRQCDFIPHSKDVDLGIWIKDYKEGLVDEFLRNGFTLKHKFGKKKDSFELSFLLNDLKLDIFFFYEEANIMWNGGTQVKTGRKFKYIFPKFALCWTTILELIVRVPCPTKPYIMANYGKNWNMLVKTWNWKASPPNVRDNGEWPIEERKEVIQVF